MKIEIHNAQNLSFREKQVVVLKESGMSASKIAKKLKIAESTVATLYNLSLIHISLGVWNGAMISFR